MKDDKVYIRHILDEVHFIIDKSTDLTCEGLKKDEILKRAFARSLEVIGEAAKNLSPGFREKYSGVNWRDLTGLSDKLIHHYFGINWNRVWDVVQNIIPDIQGKLEEILQENDAEK